MLAVPPAVLDLLKLHVGSVVGIDVEGESLVIRSQKRPRYKLDELLAQCDTETPLSDEDRRWIDLPSAGDEL